MLDVIIDHSIYGKISAELNLSSRYEVDLFVKRISDENVTPLSLLTDGLHIHTIAIKNLESYEKIIEKLSELKVLVENE